MANVIRHKRGTSDPVASDFSSTGELLVNTSDGGVFTKTDGGSVVEVGASGTATSLTTARTIALGGDLSGSTSFDGSANVTITATVADDSHNHVVSNVDGLQTALDAKAALASPALTGTPTAPTAAAGTNTTQVATTAFVSTAVANVVDAAPGALDTLNELAAALGDDANFSTTVTNSIATKLPLAGGQMTGNITFSSTQTVDGRDLSVDGAKLDGIASGATNVTNNNQLTNGAGYITSSGSITGNAATATKLATARTIGGVSFDGTANINLPGVNTTGNQNTSGNAATTSQREFSNDISTTGQGRFTGWYSGNASSALGVEVGTSSGQGYVLAYNRSTSSYGTLNISGSGSSNLQLSGSTINATAGSLQQGGNQVLHAGNYTSYSPSLTGSGASGTWGISVTGSAGSVSSTLTRGSYLTGSNFNGSAATTWAVDATTSATANKIVARDANGDTNVRYLYSSWLNVSHAQTTANNHTEFYSGTSGWLYKNTASGMRASLNVPTRTGGDASGTWGINITGNASGTSGSVASQGNYNTSASTTAVYYGNNIRLDFVRSTEGWPSYGSVLHWSAYSGGGGGCQFYAPYGSGYGGTHLRYRLADYSANTSNPPWTSWKTIPDLESTQTFTGANRGSVDALSSASTITPNFNNSNNFSISLSTNTTIANPSNLTAGQSGAIAITYNGGYTVAFGSYWKFPGGTAPTATSTSGKTDVLVYYVESSTRISAQLLLNMGG